MQMNHDITIQDIFHRFLPQYCETHNFSPQQQLTALCISKCHTLEMGANLSECESCHKKYIHYNSCKNRHCPMCQGMEVDEWIDKQQENVLDVPYFHTVFTVPEELYSLIYSNQKLLYDALYHAAHQTMTELSADPKSEASWSKDWIYLCTSYLGFQNKLSSSSPHHCSRRWT